MECPLPLGTVRNGKGGRALTEQQDMPAAIIQSRISVYR